MNRISFFSGGIPLLVVIMHGLFAATFPLGQQALAYADTWWLVALRMLIAGACFLVWQCVSTPAHPEPVEGRARQYLQVAYVSIWYVAIAYVPEMWALAYLPSFKVNLLWSAQPFLAVIIDRLVYDIRINRYQALALCTGTLAMIPLMVSSAPLDTLAPSPGYLLPELAVLLSVVSTLYGWVLLKRMTAQGYSLVYINGYTLLFGGLTCALCAAANTWWFGGSGVIALAPALGYASLLALMGNLIGYIIYGYLLRYVSLGLLSFSGFLCPVWGLILALLWGEPISIGSLICLVGVVASLTGYYLASRRAHTTL